jgi:hypothetical protein
MNEMARLYLGALGNLMVVVMASAYCSEVADQSVILERNKKKVMSFWLYPMLKLYKIALEDMYSESVLGFPEISTVRRNCCI